MTKVAASKERVKIAVFYLKFNFSGTQSECQSVWIQMRTKEISVEDTIR